MTRDEMMERMTALEFQEWWAFYLLERRSLLEHRQPDTASVQTPEEMLKALGG